MEDLSLLAEGFSLFMIAGTIFIAVIWILLWWIVFKKAGYTYPLILGVIMAIPFINIVMFLFFVFGEWPILRSE